MKRISRTDLFKSIANLVAGRSTCERGKVGCVIVNEGRPIVIGYNGALPKESHCSEKECDLHEACKKSVHAESNAIAFAAKKGIALEGCQIYCTHLPCPTCAGLIVQTGITEVSYWIKYRDTRGLDILYEQGIIVTELGDPT